MVKRSVKLIVLIISFLLVVGLISIFAPSSYEAPLMTSHISNYSMQDSEEILDYDLDDSYNKSNFFLNKDSILVIDFNEEVYLFELSRLTNNKAGLFFNNAELNYLFYINQQRKIDLNFDGVYDLSIKLISISDDGAAFTLEKTEEGIETSDNIEFLMDKFRGDVQEEVSMQNYVIFFLLIIVLIYICFNIIFVYILPYMKNRDLMKRRKPLDAIKYLYSEIKKEKNPKRAYSLYQRIVHLYDYLSEQDKKEVKNKLTAKERKEIQEIINSIKNMKANKWKKY